MIYYRFFKGRADQTEISSLRFPFVKCNMAKALYSQGYGHHSDEESNFQMAKINSKI